MLPPAVGGEWTTANWAAQAARQGRPLVPVLTVAGSLPSRRQAAHWGALSVEPVPVEASAAPPAGPWAGDHWHRSRAMADGAMGDFSRTISETHAKEVCRFQAFTHFGCAGARTLTLSLWHACQCVHKHAGLILISLSLRQ